MGAVASSDVVIAATGHDHGQAPAAVVPVTEQVVGLDAHTGDRLWSMKVGNDGQRVPAMIAGGTAIVAKADGTVVGLDASRGDRKWETIPPSGCAESQELSDIHPSAQLLADAPAPLVLYPCGSAPRVVLLDPATGKVRWTWQVPAGRSVEYQSAAAGTTAVFGLVVSDGASAYSLFALSGATGRPMWHADGLTDDVGVFAGAGDLCGVSSSRVACYDETSGKPTWTRTPPAVPDRDTLGPIGAVAENGRLHLVEPTAAAAKIPPASTSYRAKPGAFRLLTLDLASGRVIAAQALPAFYRGPDGVVTSVDVPPAVVAVAAGHSVVSPEFHETSTVEAFAN
ncbi:hypothetical protein GCM10022286_02920 [Gryllotalpicola daejeonensis]|uniref:Pyrrolo-quinoline quinone repeat domain-containing protein n=2 Tax=Gryllotalpicola daejeonensis TaxID=993087 RepID=A0ABP7ZE22_9MICO